MSVFREGKKHEITCDSGPKPGRSYWGTGHKACIADFYRCIEENEPFPNRPDACDMTMETLLALYEQARSLEE